jgi:hypothetical protein
MWPPASQRASEPMGSWHYARQMQQDPVKCGERRSWPRSMLNAASDYWRHRERCGRGLQYFPGSLAERNGKPQVV